MQQQYRRRWMSRVNAVAALAMLGFLTMHSDALARRSTSIKGQLRATAINPNAEGTFEENVGEGPGGAGDMQGGLTVQASKLNPKTSFAVKVGGVRVGTLTTNKKGRGQARFQAHPRKGNQALTVDPRGKLIAVMNANDDEVLEGEVSDPTTPGGINCCLNTADEQGCDSLLPDACALAGGTNRGGDGTCEPDPCPQGPSGLCDGESDGDCDDGAPDSGGTPESH